MLQDIAGVGNHKDNGMKTLAIITGICLLLIALFVVAVLMVCVIRIQEQDEKIEELQRDIRNCQQAGQLITERMNRYERDLQGDNAR